MDNLSTAPRNASRPVLAGVCAQVADWLEVNPNVLRVLFAAAVLADGFGLAAYGFAYVALQLGLMKPRPADDPNPVRDLAVLCIGVGGIWAVMGIRDRSSSWFFATLAIGAALTFGMSGGREDLDWQGRLMRLVVAAGALAAGTYVIGSQSIGNGYDDRTALITVMITLVGAVVFTTSGFVNLGRGATNERLATAREQARAEVAAHLHDSVLQTLALIQRNPHDPTKVAALARRQERELRQWLYEGETYLQDETSDASIAIAFRNLAASIEDLQEIKVSAVIAGDGLGVPGIREVLAATQEALVNAAKFSDCETVSMFVELTPTQVEVFVRDRGVGFNLEEVPSDRRGIRESIVARMERVGGKASIRTSTGNGTEVSLTFPLLTS